MAAVSFLRQIETELSRMSCFGRSQFSSSSHTHSIKKQNRFIVVRVAVSCLVLRAFNPFYNTASPISPFPHFPTELQTHRHTTTEQHKQQRAFYFPSSCTFFGLTLYLNFIFIFMLAKAQRHKKPFLVNSFSRSPSLPLC